ncbi:MAG: peptidoglycan editing factor PgeF [Sandaracinaceae bacterium]|jgi:YfiH family protein|nr:peptidoglycan editing factor PgeF [Sandaracinaceae bacterium]
MSHALRSQLLSRHAITHGFSLRTGGVSRGAFAGLNLGRAVGDELGAVEENHRVLARAVGYDAARLFETAQVHGRAVRVIGANENPAEVRREEADALVTNVRDVAIGVRVADCLPLLLADPKAGVVGAVHAGWRGAAANIVGASLDAMASLGASPADIVASIGPHIRSCCFEVGDEVVDALGKVAHRVEFVDATQGPKPHVNLSRVVSAQLQARGVLATGIDEVEGCTRCDAARFFSYRRDGKASGRHLAVIAIT